MASSSSTNTSTTTGSASGTVYTNGYANGTLLTATSGASRSGWACKTDTCVIGRTSLAEYLNGQMYYLYYFNAGLSSFDLKIIEST